METGMTSIFKAMDSDGDGMVNVEEYVNYWCGSANKTEKASGRGNKQPQFKKMDKNNDGKIESENAPRSGQSASRTPTTTGTAA